MSKAEMPSAGAESDTSREQSKLCRDSFERYRHFYNALSPWIVVQISKVKKAIDAANNFHPSPPGDLQAFIKTIRLYYQSRPQEKAALKAFKKNPLAKPQNDVRYPQFPERKDDSLKDESNRPANTPVAEIMAELVSAMDHLDSFRRRINYNYKHNPERAYCPIAVKNLANTKRWIYTIQSALGLLDDGTENQAKVHDFYMTRKIKLSYESLLKKLKKDLCFHSRVSVKHAKENGIDHENKHLQDTLQRSHDLHNRIARYQRHLSSNHTNPFAELNQITPQAQLLAQNVNQDMLNAETAIKEHTKQQKSLELTRNNIQSTIDNAKHVTGNLRRDLNKAEKDLKKHNDKRAELEREYTRLYNLKALLEVLEANTNSQNTLDNRVEVSSASLLADIQAPQKLDAALLAYDRIRLIQRIYSFGESLIYWPIAAIDILVTAGTFTALTAFCASNAAYGIMESISTIAKSGSLYMTIIGVSWMFLDAFTQMCLAFRKRPEETTQEWKERIKQDWRQLLKAKIFERGRWVAFLFSGLVAGLMLTTKDFLSGNYMAIYVVVMLSKLLYVGIACGLIGHKYKRLDRDIKILKAINANEEKTNGEIQDILTAQKVTSEEINAFRDLLRITDSPKKTKAEEKRQLATQNVRSRPGKINWYFLLPTMWIPLGSLWIARAVNLQKNKHLKPGETKKPTFDFLMATPERIKSEEPCPLILELEAQKLKQAATFRNKILCMGYKITLLAVLASTVFDIPPEAKAAIYLIYGVAHALYKIIRFVLKKGKRAKFNKELSSIGRNMTKRLSTMSLYQRTPSPPPTRSRKHFNAALGRFDNQRGIVTARPLGAPSPIVTAVPVR